MSVKQKVSTDERLLLRQGACPIPRTSLVIEVDLGPRQVREELEAAIANSNYLPLKNLLDSIACPAIEDEEYALLSLKRGLNENKSSYIKLKRILYDILNKPSGFIKRTGPEQIVNLTASILREEMSVMSAKGKAARRGLDVVRMIIKKKEDSKEGSSRTGPTNRPILMEMQTDLSRSRESRANNFATETHSNSIDKGGNHLNQLKATTNRGFKEEALKPLQEDDSSITDESIEELAELLLHNVTFDTESGRDSPSGSTQVISHYRLHTVDILVPSPEATDLSGNAKKLLRKLRDTEGIKRKREGDSLVWVPPISHPGTAPFYRHPRDDANQMVEMQETREKELRVDYSSRKPELASGSTMKDASRDEWLKKVPAKYEDLEAAIRDHIHEDDLEDILPQFRELGNENHTSGRGIMAEGRKKLYNPVRATISVMCAVADYDCKVLGCESKKGEPCKPMSDDPNEFAADKYNFNGKRHGKKSYRFRAHKSRLDAYRGREISGTSELERDLNHNVRYHKSRLESTSINIVIKDKDDKIKPIILKDGIELHQIQLKRNKRDKVIETQSGKVTLELDPEVKREYNPDPKNANSSTDGWWLQVHIDQSTDDMRKIAEVMKAKSFGFILLCCPTGKQQNRALGIISVSDLESLANHLD